jgi:hypothetical protein
MRYFVLTAHLPHIIFGQNSENVTGGIRSPECGFCKGKIGRQEFYRNRADR